MPSPYPKMDRRIDYFAMAALEGLLDAENIQQALFVVEKRTGTPRPEVLADWAYAIAIAMEAKADTV